MLSLSDRNAAALIEAFDSTFTYLDYLFIIDKNI